MEHATRGRCPQCPMTAAGLPGPCLGERMPAVTYCELARSDIPSVIRTILAWQPSERAEIEYSDGMDAWTLPERASPAADLASLRPSVAASLSVLERMRECDSRTEETSCGCGGLARCARGKGRDGLVSHTDCFSCLQTTTGAARQASSNSGS